MGSIQEIRNAQRAKGPATILAIGTANPPNVLYQNQFPDFYFRVTNSEHLTDAKAKFKRICEGSMIKKRYMHLTEELLKENPHMLNLKAGSLDTRQEILAIEVPKLGKEAAVKAIKEWGQPKSKITHILFCTMSGVDMPGADYRLANLLELDSSVKRFMMYQYGCNAGATALRLAKDIAENNRGARVLVVCCEMTLTFFNDVNESRADKMVGHAIFADGAGAMIVGSDPDTMTEHPIFELVWASQTTLPNSMTGIEGRLKEIGMDFHLSKDVPFLVSENIEKTLFEAFNPIGISDWNSIFWATHPGGKAILDKVEAKLGLKNKLTSARHVWSEYGNMYSVSVIFILDDMRKRSFKEHKATTGEGLEWGILHGFGPGLTIETVLLHSVPITYCDVENA